MATLSPEEFNAKLNAAPQAPVEPEEEKPITLNDTLMQSAASNELDWQTQLKGLGIEGGGSVVGTAATLKGIKTYKTLNMLRNVRRVGQGAALAGAAGPQAFEPVSTAAGIGTVLITEGLWSVGSNFLKQEYFKSKGIQEETSGGELLTSMVLLSPIIHQGRHIPKLGQIFDTSMIKSRTWKVGAHTVQGATIGAVESSIRQTWDLVAAEDKDLTDFSFTDLATGVVGGAGLGGAVSTVGETFSGLKLLNTYRKVVQRSKIEMTGSLNERLARLEKTIEKSRRMNNGRRLMLAQQAYADTKKKRDIFYALHDELEDNLDSLEAAATPKPKPEAPEASATTATPKDAPEATPAPKTPEVAPEAQSPMQGVYDSYEKLINNMDEGRGGNLTAELNDTFNRAADDFNQRAEAFIENPNDDTIASLEEVLDEFIILDKYDARLKQSQGQGLEGQKKNAKDSNRAGELPLPRKTRQEGLKGVREKLRLMRDDGDFSRFDEFLEKVLETPETPVVTPKGGEAPSPKPKDPEASTGKTKAPKKTPQQRQVERLQKQLDDLRAIRSGEQDPKAPKPKKAKSAEVKDLEDRIKFYKGESKEVAEIAKTEERIALFLKLLRGGDVKAMQQELGLPPAMRPEFTKKKTPESYLNDLKEIESGLKKDIRKRQTQEILADINKATNPSAGTSSPVDSLLDGLIAARTASLLNQPTTSTTGLPSGAIAYFWRMGRNSINDALKLSGITGLADPRLKGTRFKQKAILATSEMVATATQIFDISPKALISGGRNMKETFLNLGNSAYFYKDGNKFIEQEGQVGNAPMKAQAAAKAKREELRLRAIQAEGMLERVLLNTGASKPFEYITKLYLLGRTVLGTLDEPFLMAMNDRGNRAEAIRQSILTNAADPEKFIQDYMANVSKFEGGATRFNYFDEQYKDVANQTRRDLFRKADLDRKDIRRNPSEIVADGINRLFAGSVVGKLLGGLFSPFVSTPVIGLGQNVGNQMSSFGVQPTVRLTQGISDRLHRLIFPHRQSSAVFGKYNKALQSARLEAKKLQEEIDGKTAKGEDVKSEEVALGIKNEEIERLTRYKEDAARDDLARSMIAFSIGLFAYYATKEGLMLGSGAGLEDEQRRESNFQKRKNRIFLDDTKSVGFSYMLFEQFRGTMSIWSDIASYEMLADNGALTDDQKGVEGFINFLTNSIEATATDAPFTTGLRQFSDLAIGDTEEKMQTAVSIGSSSLGVPSGVRSANRFGDDVYYDYSRGLTMENLFGRIGDAALGLPTQNVRTDQLGRPVSPNQKSPWNYAFRYAPERLKPENALERDAMIEDLLLNDATSFGLISKKPTSLHINKVTVPMKKFVNQDGDDLTSLYERTLNEDDAMIDEIWEEMQTSSWETAYDNYKVDSKDGKPFNKGIERINKIIKKHRNKTKKKLSDETGPLQYYYYKGQNVFEYIQAQKMLPQATGDSKGILH